MKKIHILAILFAMLCLYALPSFSVMLDIRNGILHGAKEVQVGGALYDVAFRDGTCIDLYGNCDEANDFPFNGSVAVIANLALLEQVFLDTAAGLFDTNPTLTFGCENAGNTCRVITPVDDQEPSLPLGAGSPNGNFSAAFLSNSVLERLDIHTGSGSGVRAGDTTSNINRPIGVTNALWSPTTPVPIPATLYLVLVGMIALGYRRRL